MAPYSTLIFLIGISVVTPNPNVNNTSNNTAACDSPFASVGVRCVYVDLVIEGPWQTMRDQCYQLGGDLITLNSGDFYAQLVSYIHGNGWPDRDYWVGATDQGHDGVWLWVDGAAVQMGTPFWAHDGCSGDQYPTGETGLSCAVLGSGTYLYMVDKPCTEHSAFPICEK